MDWQEVQNESTEDLLQFIGYKDQSDYRELAEAAFVAFTFRFRKEVVDKCRKIGKKWGYDREEADIISEKVFERFWKYSSAFDACKCKDLGINDCIVLYFFKIIRNCFVNHYNEKEGVNLSPYDGTEEVVVEFPSMENIEIPAERATQLLFIQKGMDDALSRLSPKHKIIFLTYKAYEKEGYKLPRNLLKKLREELDLKQDSIRVYKKEAFEKVDHYLKSYDADKI